MVRSSSLAVIGGLAVVGGLLAAAPAHARRMPPPALPTCTAADAPLREAWLDADGVRVCFDGTPATCWHLGFATRTWTARADAPAPAAPPAPPTPPAAMTTFDTRIRVCAPDGAACSEVDVPGVAGLQPADVVVSADRRRVAVIGPAEPTRGGANASPLRLYETIADGASAGRLIATIRGWRTEMGRSIRGARFLGDTLLVVVSESPVSSAARLYAGRTGRLLADVGGKGRELDDGGVIDLGGGRWAFAAFDTNTLVVHDVATGKQLPPIPTAASRRLAPRGSFALLRTTPDGATLVAVRGDAASGATLIDVASRNNQRVAVPTCK